MPSMFMTERAAKWRMLSRSLAGQLALTQRWSASPSSRTTLPPHSGHFSGMWNFLWPRGCCLSSTTETTLGMTSPPRSTCTQSPIFTPRRSISSWLCRVARLTVVPPMETGVSAATGVSLPVRPTCTKMSSTWVMPPRAAHL